MSHMALAHPLEPIIQINSQAIAIFATADCVYMVGPKDKVEIFC